MTMILTKGLDLKPLYVAKDKIIGMFADSSAPEKETILVLSCGGTRVEWRISENVGLFMWRYDSAESSPPQRSSNAHLA